MKVVIVTETRQGRFQQEVRTGKHLFLADEPIEVGGLDSGPGPYDLLLAALGACTAMTLRLYAERKALPLDRVTVRLSHSKIYAEDCANLISWLYLRPILMRAARMRARRFCVLLDTSIKKRIA